MPVEVEDPAMPFGNTMRTKPETVDDVLAIVSPALRLQFDAYQQARRSWSGGIELYRYATAPGGPGDDDDRSPFQENAEYVAAMRRLEWLKPISDTSAVALLVSADLLVAEWEKRYGIRDKYVTRDKAGPDVGKAHFGGVLRVSVNNARHFTGDDWKTRTPKSDADRNIQVLEAAGLSGPWDRLVADAVLQRLGMEFDAFADALAQTLRDLERRTKK
jgi:hypothetical protein